MSEFSGHIFIFSFSALAIQVRFACNLQVNNLNNILSLLKVNIWHCSTENILCAIVLTILLFQTRAELPVSKHQVHFKQIKQQEPQYYYCISSQYCQSTIELPLTGCCEKKITVNSQWREWKEQTDHQNGYLKYASISACSFNHRTNYFCIYLNWMNLRVNLNLHTIISTEWWETHFKKNRLAG